MKKIFISTFIALCLLVSATSAFAITETYNSGGKTFQESWEVPQSGTNWLMKYGYNTDFWNEDYTHTYHTIYSHTAVVANGSGAYSDGDSAGNWAGIEVLHTSNVQIEYSLIW